MTESIEQQLRAHLQRKLRILNGSGQITVRRLVKCIYPKKNNSFKYEEEPKNENRHSLYCLAAELCERAGGKVEAIAYNRCKRPNADNVAARVYQF